MERLVFDAQLVSPLSGSLSLAADSYHAIVAAIVLLLFLSRPAAVLGFIVSARINSINRMLLRGALAHIGNKVLERFPSLAYGDAFRTVFAIARDIFILAALTHIDPNMIFARIRKTVRGIAGDAYCSMNFNIQTPA